VPIVLSDDELLMELDFNRKPLDEIKETAHEWVLGTWSLSKAHRLWRVGVGHDLLAGAVLRAFAFEVYVWKGVGVLFESSDQPPWIFLGWVRPERAKDAESWVAFLNSEIEGRLAGQPAGVNWTHDPRDGSAAQDIEDEIAREKFEKSLGVKPYKPKPRS